MRCCRAVVAGAACLMVAFSCYCLRAWHRDTLEIRRRLAPFVAGRTKASILDASVRYMREQVRAVPNDEYFLVPALSFLRPSALQVLDDGGDCSHQARALVVILRQFGIEASKRAVFHHGSAVHTVLVVTTDSEEVVIDPLFHFAHRYPDGRAIPLERLRDPLVFSQSLEWARDRGDLDRSTSYPRQYFLDDVRTIDWNRTRILHAAYQLLTQTIGAAAANRITRPYILEEPWLMVSLLGGLASAALLLLQRQLPRTPRLA